LEGREGGKRGCVGNTEKGKDTNFPLTCDPISDSGKKKRGKGI